jgi:hypothetical protein
MQALAIVIAVASLPLTLGGLLVLRAISKCIRGGIPLQASFRSPKFAFSVDTRPQLGRGTQGKLSDPPASHGSSQTDAAVPTMKSQLKA